MSRLTKKEEKSAVSAISSLSPFPGEGKGFGVKVEAPHYSKEGLGWLRKERPW